MIFFIHNPIPPPVIVLPVAPTTSVRTTFLPRDHSHEAWYLHLLIIGEEGDRESGENLPCGGGGGGAGIVLLKLQIPNCHPQVIHVQTGSARGLDGLVGDYSTMLH